MSGIVMIHPTTPNLSSPHLLSFLILTYAYLISKRLATKRQKTAILIICKSHTKDKISLIEANSLTGRDEITLKDQNMCTIHPNLDDRRNPTSES